MTRRFTSLRRTTVALLALAPAVVAGSTARAAEASHPYIVGGGPADAVVASVVVRVEMPDGGLCSGTVIDPSWVLTAAHCVAERATLRGGGDTVAGLTWSSGATGFAHPDFDGAAAGSWYDIGLYRLDAPVAAPAVPLVGYGDDAAWRPGTVLTEAGWGSTAPGGPPAASLQKGTVTVISDAACAFAVGATGFHPASDFCVDAPVARACSGDSGGPLLAVVGGRLLLVGFPVASMPDCHGVTVAAWLPAGLTWIRSMIAGGPEMVRRWGADRYGTAAAVGTMRAFSPGGTVFVATGESFPDSLAAGATASRFGAPVLLVTRTTVPAATADALAYLKPVRVVVAGGPAAVSEAVLAKLRQVTGAAVERLGGSDRFETALLLSHLAWAGASNRTVWVAGGTAYADPLIASAAAAVYGEPFVLVEGGDTMRPSVHDALVALQPSAIVVVGDARTVSDGQRAQLAAIAPLQEVFDADVHTRSLQVWDRVPAAAGAVVATSQNFPDALAGVAFAGVAGVPLVLTPSACFPAATRQRVAGLAPQIVVLLGGPAALSPAIEAYQPC